MYIHINIIVVNWYISAGGVPREERERSDRGAIYSFCAWTEEMVVVAGCCIHVLYSIYSSRYSTCIDRYRAARAMI